MAKTHSVHIPRGMFNTTKNYNKVKDCMLSRSQFLIATSKCLQFSNQVAAIANPALELVFALLHDLYAVWFVYHTETVAPHNLISYSFLNY